MSSFRLLNKVIGGSTHVVSCVYGIGRICVSSLIVALIQIQVHAKEELDAR
jgi:hypothetical protein